MQGIQIFTTTDDGWGGFASEYVLALRDEYPKTELWTWGIERSEKLPMVCNNLISSPTDGAVLVLQLTK